MLSTTIILRPLPTASPSNRLLPYRCSCVNFSRPHTSPETTLSCTRPRPSHGSNCIRALWSASHRHAHRDPYYPPLLPPLSTGADRPCTIRLLSAQDDSVRTIPHKLPREAPTPASSVRDGRSQPPPQIERPRPPLAENASAANRSPWRLSAVRIVRRAHRVRASASVCLAHPD